MQDRFRRVRQSSAGARGGFDRALQECTRPQVPSRAQARMGAFLVVPSKRPGEGPAGLFRKYLAPRPKWSSRSPALDATKFPEGSLRAKGLKIKSRTMVVPARSSSTA
eukprot:4008605-Pyramimonas_sp.AAC.1